MGYQQKEGSGALFSNDKGDNPARPDYRGDIMLNGVVYELSGWVKPLSGDSGKRMLSLSGKVKQARPAQNQGYQDPYREPPRQAQRPPPQRTPSQAGPYSVERRGMDDLSDEPPF